jgi:hypothetical protein
MHSSLLASVDVIEFNNNENNSNNKDSSFLTKTGFLNIS